MKGVGRFAYYVGNCAVLLISWEAKLDGLHTGEEVDALEAVFKYQFCYTLVKKPWMASALSLHIEVQRLLLDFVVEHDNESTLLIVYYAGHSISRRLEGEGPVGIPLLLAG